MPFDTDFTTFRSVRLVFPDLSKCIHPIQKYFAGVANTLDRYCLNHPNLVRLAEFRFHANLDSSIAKRGAKFQYSAIAIADRQSAFRILLAHTYSQIELQMLK
ncbi:hypothetical protein [Chamaesiphon sp.]|uniref:hypothetical protein n=1 Tax=Chamaesiphon sp. TaxID=2814140 RepID=UPI0035948739